MEGQKAKYTFLKVQVLETSTIQQNFVWWWKYSVTVLPNRVAMGHMIYWAIELETTGMEGLKFLFFCGQ